MPFVRKRFPYRFAEEVLNSHLALKQEIEQIICDPSIDPKVLSRPVFNDKLRSLFTARGWQDQPKVFGEVGDPDARMDFLKDRVGIEVGFGHASFIGIDLLKFQVSSYSALNTIDVGVYIVTTKSFQTTMKKQFGQNWEGGLSFEKVEKYLPYFRSAIQVPIYVFGIDL